MNDSGNNHGSYGIGLDVSQLKKDVEEGVREFSRLGDSAERQGSRADSAIGNIGRTAKTVAGALKEMGVKSDFLDDLSKGAGLADQVRRKVLELGRAHVQEAAQQGAATQALRADTIAKGVNTAATNAATAGTNAYTRSVIAMKAAWAADPLGLALVALSSLAGLLGIVTARGHETTFALAEFNKELRDEQDQLEDVFSRLENTRAGTVRHKEAVDEVNELCKEYNRTLLSENATLEQQKEKYKELTVAIREATAEKIRNKYIEQAQDTEDKDLDRALRNLKRGARNAYSTEQRYSGGSYAFLESDNIREANGAFWDLLMQEIRVKVEEIKDLTGDELQAALEQATDDTMAIIQANTGASDREIEGFRSTVLNTVTSVTSAVQKTAQTVKDVVQATTLAGLAVDEVSGAADKAVAEMSFEEIEAQIQSVQDEIDRLNGKELVVNVDDSALDQLVAKTEYAIEQMGVNGMLQRLGEMDAALGHKVTEGSDSELKDRMRRLQTVRDDIDRAVEPEKWAKYNSLIGQIDRTLKSRRESYAETSKSTGSDDAERRAEQERVQNDKFMRLKEQNAADEERRVRNLELQTRQAEIDAMDDGLEKTLAQLELNHEREKAKIEQDYEDIRLTKIRKARELFEADPANKGKSFTYTDADFGYTVGEIDNNYARNSANDAQYARAKEKAYSDLLAKYQDYATKRAATAKKYDDDIAAMNARRGSVEKAELDKIDAAIIEATKQRNSALLKLDQQYSGDLQKIFADTATMTRDAIMEAVRLAEQQLEQLTSSGAASIEDIQRMSDRVTELRQAMAGYDFRGWGGSSVTGALSTLASARAYGTSAAQKLLKGDSKGAEADLSKQAEAMARFRKEAASLATSGFADILALAATSMKEIAAASGDTKLAQFGDAFGAAGDFLGSVAQGLAQGGPIGAAFAGITNIVNQIVSSFTQAKLEEIEMKKNAEDFRRELELAALAVDSSKFDSIFGSDRLGLMQEYFNKASEASRKYQQSIKSLGGMQVLTKDRSGWDNFWGLSDEYTSLRKLAPQLWKNGTFDVESARLFLQTNTQISDVQRQQIENVIALSDAQKDALQGLRDLLSEIFGGLANTISSVFLETRRNGTDTLEAIRKKGLDVVSDLEEQMISGIINGYLAQYQDQMIQIAGSGGGYEAMLGVYSEIFAGLGDIINASAEAADRFERIAEEQGWDISSLYGGDTRTGESRSSLGTSQDSIDESNGRLTAIQGHTFEMKEEVKEIRHQNDTLLSHTAAILEHVQGIHMDTNEMRGTLGEIRETNQLIRSGISTIIDRGVKMQ